MAWQAIFDQSWQDVWSTSGAKRLIPCLFLLGVFVISQVALHKIFGKESTKKKLVEAGVGLAATVALGATVFVFCMIFVAPAQVINTQHVTIEDLQAVTNTFQQQLINKADAEWKSSSVYQRQLSVKADLINMGAWFSKMADKIEKNKSENMQDSIEASNFIMGRADDVLRESRNENLPAEKLSGIIYGAINVPLAHNKMVAYRDAAAECKSLADQLPKKLWP
jgi:hypothetical protein